MFLARRSLVTHPGAMEVFLFIALLPYSLAHPTLLKVPGEQLRLVRGFRKSMMVIHHMS